MRSTLVSWLVQVHEKLNLYPDTLFQCVNLLDRYTELCSNIKREEYQLVGITALWIVCKYSEMYPPQLHNFLYMTNYTYSRQQMLDCEYSILSAVGFELTVPTVHQFLQRFM